ncbi:MAG: hypothetical protein H0V50_00460, partial [Thermoleophilaceae bacterium]|nr:hypothetical protein [Thermoleophilaceae bacterium]
MALSERRQSPPDQQILAAAVAFARALRDKGMSASVDSELVFIRMLAELDVREREQVYWAALATFVHSPDERPAFDNIFESFWEGRPLDAGERGSEHGEADARMVGPQQQGGEALPQFRQEAKEKSQQGDGAKQKASREIPTGDDEAGAAEQRGVLAAYSPAEQESDKK